MFNRLNLSRRVSMNSFRFGFLVALAVALLGTASISAAQYSGLWLGTVTIKAVSEVNQREPDLSFDLALEGVEARETLIPKSDMWRVYETGNYPGSTWREPDYVDSSWNPNSSAPYSYPDPNTTNPVVTTYFRKTFDMPGDPDDYENIRLKVWRDDGIIIYLNGREILRNNLSTSYVDFDSRAISEIEADPNGEDNTYLEITLPATLLKSVNNCLAAEVHPAGYDDSDLLFDLELTASPKSPVTATFIDFESDVWHYHDPPDGLDDPNWYRPEYNETWSTGRAGFGYGERDPNCFHTLLAYGTSQKPPATYFRKSFDVEDPGSCTRLRFMLLADDGAVVYLNGIEIMRANMPSGPIDYATAPVKVLGSSDENRYIVKDIDPAEIGGLILQINDNVMAVEVHQHPAELGDTAGVKTVLTRTPATFDLRILLHVDSSNTVRLLKEVIQMYDEAHNQMVLLTDHNLIPEYQGVALLDGELVGRRVSTVGFDFETPYVECDGEVSPSGTVTCSFTLDKSHPTNPFLHRYHPDHDNLDARYDHTVEEAFTIGREIKLEFSDRFPPDEDEPERPIPPPGWGESLLGGRYTETLKGLHKDDLTVSGPVVLQRVSDTVVLK